MGVTFRTYRDEDEQGMLRLWSEFGGWDQATIDLWRHRFMDTPAGRSYIAVGQEDDSGDIVAQLICVPSVVAAGDREIPAARPFAPIVSQKVRKLFLTANPLKHPIVQMFRRSTELLREQGVGLSYMLPDPSWQLLYKMLPGRVLQVGTFPFWSRPLPLERPLDLGSGVTARPMEPTDSRLDGLFRAASKLYDCMVVRDTRGLPWKISHGGFHLLGVESGGELIGAVASEQKGDRQWLICDLLSVDAGDALRATLAAAVNFADEQSRTAPEDAPIIKVGVLTTPLMEPVLGGLGFQRDDYDFPFVVRVIDPDLDRKEFAPSHWYVSAND